MARAAATLVSPAGGSRAARAAATRVQVKDPGGHPGGPGAGDPIAPAGTALDLEAPRCEISLPEGPRERLTALLPAGAALAVLVLLLAAASTARWWPDARGRGETASAGEGAARRALAQRRFREGVALVRLGRWRAARDPLEAAAGLDAHDPTIARYLARASAEAPREQHLEQALAALQRRDFAAAKRALGGIPEDSLLAGEAQELEDELRSGMDAAVREARARAEASDAASAVALLAPVLAADPGRADALAVREAMSPRKRRLAGSTSSNERIPGMARLR